MNNRQRFGTESVTYAIKARDILSRQGIRAEVVRLAAGESPAGCAYGVELYRADSAAAHAILTAAKLPHRMLG